MALSSGVPRREPVALLVGVGLAVTLAHALVVAVVRWARLSRAGVYPPVRTWEVMHGDQCDPAPAITCVGPPWLVHGYATVRLVAGTRTHLAGAPVSYGARVPPGAHTTSPAITIPCAPVPRGLYRLQRVTVRFTDLLSLFRVVLEYTEDIGDSPYPPLLRVLPQASSDAQRFIPPGVVAGTRADGLSRDRSEELIEARPYHPGDDTRRINWKAYAHSETLFVRIGEEIPPPSIAAKILVDIRGVESHSQLDQLISAALGVAVELERPNCSVTLSAQVDQRGALVLGTVDEGRRALAAADPVYGFLIDPIPPGPHRVHPGGAHTLVVATGRSPAAPAGRSREILVWDQQHPQGDGRERTISYLD
ncbi:MAG: DUF58 domain-containing protein [Alkalispirochaeta sp.]